MAELELALHDPKPFGTDSFRELDPVEAAGAFWPTLPPLIYKSILTLLPDGAAGLGKRRKGQRYWLGMQRSPGVLLGWRSNPDRPNRSRTAILWCSTCHRVGELRLDTYLGDSEGSGGYASCGCRGEKNRRLQLQRRIDTLPDAVQAAIAADLELGVDRVQIIREFGLDRQSFKGWVAPMLTSIWRHETETTWLRLGAGRMREVAALVRVEGTGTALASLGLRLSMVRFALRWAKDEQQKISLCGDRVLVPEAGFEPLGPHVPNARQLQMLEAARDKPRARVLHMPSRTSCRLETAA